jgi:DNA-binding response OmpR family regulator
MPIHPVKPRLLIVEDEPLIARLMVHVLSRAGCQCRLADDYDVAVAAFEPATCDAAILDLHLPGGAGFALAGQLRARSPSLPVLLVTGGLPEADFEDEIQAAGYRLLFKPFLPDQLVAEVFSLLDPSAQPAPSGPALSGARFPSSSPTFRTISW